MEIREARPNDLPVLVELWVAAWGRTMPSIDFDARRSWFIGHIQSLCRAGVQILVAVDDMSPIGFVTVDPDTGMLDQLAVAHHRQGQGCARQLLEAAKIRAPQGLTLSVNEDNPGAIAFYRKQGFRVTGAGRNQRSGLPILHMAWRPDRDDADL